MQPPATLPTTSSLAVSSASPATQLNVAIVGAGTAGPAAALFLSRSGHRVTLFERAQQPAAIGAGITLQPTGLSVLELLGLRDQVVERGARIARLYGRTLEGRTVLDLSYETLHPEYFGLGTHRGLLFSTLMEAVSATDVQLRTGCQVYQLREHGNAERGGVTVSSAAGEETFDLVIVADGARSGLRAQLAVPTRVRPYEWGALWTVLPFAEELFSDAGFAHSSLSHTLTQVFQGTKRFVGFLPTGYAPGTSQRVVSLFWSIPVREMDGFIKQGIGHFKDQIRALTPDVEPLLEVMNQDTQILPAHYFDVVMRRPHTARIVCIGDAAHAMSPQLGQGANLALYDAWVLSHSLAHSAADIPKALADYHRARRAHLRFYQYATRWLTPFFQSDWGLLGALRDITMGPLCRLPFFGRQGLGAMAGYKTGIWGGVPIMTAPLLREQP